ncbi:cyclopropane-fatty-acyl-phospholipid synthase [Nitrospirillum viridazoti Y2]|uniref:Cyclopropane-fatty-acyl-phospholipid synthase n=1 Tax=Nitrospirillum amazonense TaxID=28077 RepID=A0A560IL01_9PROT|nr:cyclopropane-fatty-acyl-phospholipid synthase family protein [Nitrospirillum amazonense]EGY01719.1 cyclopropane-fatty-acyl-phospholipid synthase [Nitrospirillum amazonense Y2]TWB59718.1 cyclopropane-fatty-acyl-phospholipid synthase [Nitrospirillum amazonense]
MLLASLFRSLIKTGHLTLIDAHGRRYEFGRRDPDALPGGVSPGGIADGGPASYGPVTVRVTDPSLHWKLALAPRLYAGEAYMDGTLVMEEGSIYDLLALVTRNSGWQHIGWSDHLMGPIETLTRYAQQFNPAQRSKANVAHHYDLSGKLYSLFLDSDRQYSCAYFPTPETTLEEAQSLKKRHIIAKLRLEPGMKVLDIGCGWGGMALEIARQAPDARIMGITLSEEQLAVARQRAIDEGVTDRVTFELVDYRHLKGQGYAGHFDRIVSVGMFEHVGLPHYLEYFEAVRDLMTPEGVALIHAIGRLDGPGATNPWIRKYIFPGGYVPALSEVMPAVEKARIVTTDIEILRLHYAETLRAWRHRFLARADEAAALYDERFVRMWEFYLAGSECAFRYQGHMVFQIQLSNALAAVPLTRDYIHKAEEAMTPRAHTPAMVAE